MPKPSAKKKTARKRKRAAKPKAPERVSMAAFARAVGVSEGAVRKAIRDGRLTESAESEVKGKRTYWRIDLKAGRREWAEKTAPRKETGLPTLSMEPEALDAGPRRPARAQREDDEPINLAAERARKERALADRQELTVASLQAELMERDQAARAIEGIARGVREKLAGFAAELPDELHMLPRKQVAIILERATTEVCSELAALFQDLFVEAMRKGA